VPRVHGPRRWEPAITPTTLWSPSSRSVHDVHAARGAEAPALGATGVRADPARGQAPGRGDPALREPLRAARLRPARRRALDERADLLEPRLEGLLSLA